MHRRDFKENQTQMNKKAIVILGMIFLLIVGTLGFLVYARYFGGKNQETAAVTPTGNNGGGNTDDTSGNNSDTTNTDTVNTSTSPQPLEKFVKLTADQQVISPILFYNGNGVTYLDRNGQVYKSDFEYSSAGSLSLVRTRNLNIVNKSGIRRILWPRTGDDFIAEIVSSPDTGSSSPARPHFSYFNFSTGVYTDLPRQVKAVEWLPSGDKIMFIWVETDAEGNEKATLNIASPHLNDYQEIAELWESDDALSLSPDGLNVALYRTRNTGGVNKIFSVTADGKVWKDLVKEGYNYGVLWSPDSQKLLFAKREREGRNYQLWFYDLYDGETKNLGVSGVPQKAVWASDSRTVYLAAPRGGSAESIDPTALDADRGALTADTFYKLDTQSGEKTEIEPPANLTLDARDLFLNPSEDKLFFKNAQDGGLYYLDLTR